MGSPNLVDNGADAYAERQRELSAAATAQRLEAQFGPPAEPDQPDAAHARRLEDLTAPIATGQQQLAAGIKDVAKGVTELPRATAVGAIGAVNESLDLADAAANWANEKLGTKPGATPRFPTPDAPTSVTGGIEEGIAQFVTSFVGVGKLKWFKDWRAVTSAEKLAKSTAKGGAAMFTGFDPHAARLSDLIQAHPELANPVTEFLKSDPSDGEAEGRFKNALEGVVAGSATEGLLMGLKALRAAGKTKAVLEQIRPSLEENAFATTLGDPNEPLARMSASGFAMRTAKRLNQQGGDAALSEGDAAAMARGMDELTAPVEEPATFINFSRIDAPEDVQNIMQRMADTYKKSVDTARRGTQTFEQIKFNAEQQNAWQIISERRIGEPLNAEQAVAARNLWAASAAKLGEVAQVAANNPTPANLYAFRKMVAIHQEVQRQVIGARTETARALASWRIPAQGGARHLAELQATLASNGGEEATRDFAERISSLVRGNMPAEMDAVIAKSWGAKTKEAFIEAWINGLLSGPRTHLVNGVSNTSIVFQAMGERWLARQIAQVMGDEGSVQLGESMALWHGTVSSLNDAFRYAGKAFRTGESGYGIGKVELGNTRAISAENLFQGTSIPPTGWYGKAVDVIGAGVNVPVRALGAVDEFYKTIGYYAELNALALRQASQEVAAGKIPAEGLKARIVDLKANPPDSLHLDAIDAATYRTFTNQPGTMAQDLTKWANEWPFVRLILPFIRTPANIMHYTFERTPLAPLMSKVRADIAAGGARRDIAYARMAGGSAVMLWASDMAMRGQITGRGPRGAAEREALQRTGWQPYSIKSGDRWYAYNRLDPLGSVLGIAADTTELIANDEYGVDKEQDIERVWTAAIMAAGNNVFNKTYLTGIANFSEALTQGGGFAEAWFRAMAGSLIPTGVSNIAQYQDPFAHEASGMIDAMYAKLPGYSQDVPYRIDLWGRRVDYRSGLGGVYDAVSPIYTRRENPEPIDNEILRLEAPITNPKKATSFEASNGQSVDVNLERYPRAFERYSELAGNDLKDPVWRLGCKDFLNSVVTGKSPMSPLYWKTMDDGADGHKAAFIQSTIAHYRDMARKQLLREFPDIRAEVDSHANLKQNRFIDNLRHPSAQP